MSIKSPSISKSLSNPQKQYLISHEKWFPFEKTQRIYICSSLMVIMVMMTMEVMVVMMLEEDEEK
jgi:hypothetical protein